MLQWEGFAEKGFVQLVPTQLCNSWQDFDRHIALRGTFL